MPPRVLKTVDYTRASGECGPARERIVREAALTISVDGNPFATAMLMPSMEKEFVVGNLYAHGVIGSAGDIKSLDIINNTARVALAKKKKGGDLSAIVRSDLTVTAEDIFNCVKAILKSEVFTETEAVHSAGLFLDGKEALCIAEDLGRHNALDKIIGWGLLHGVDFNRTVAASTGRQPSEMIIKCRNAGIPVIATKGVPTTLAIEIAEKSGITIAGLVRGDTMIVYSRPGRIEGADEE